MARRIQLAEIIFETLKNGNPIQIWSLRLKEIRKRQVVSSAKLKLLERILHILSHFLGGKKIIFLCNSNQFALTVAFHFPLSLEDIYD